MVLDVAVKKLERRADRIPVEHLFFAFPHTPQSG